MSSILRTTLPVRRPTSTRLSYRGFMVAMAMTACVVFTPLRATGEIPDVIEIDPLPGVNYGFGYDTQRRQSFGRGGGCIEYNPSRKFSMGTPTSESGIDHVTSTSEIAEQMDLSVGVSIKASFGAFSGSASSKTKVSSGTNTNQYNLSILAYSYARDVPSFIDPSAIRLKQRYIDMLNDPTRRGQFRAECGDSFVYGVQEGREFYGTATVEKQTIKSWSKFQQDTSADGKYGGVSVDIDTKYAKAMSSAFGLNNIKLRMASSDPGGANPTSVEALINRYKTFNVGSGPRRPIKMFLAPYSYAEGFPIDDPLAPITNDEKLGYMANALWDLKAIIQDAGFIITSPRMFAMGTTSRKRNARLAAVRRAKAEWQREFDSLRNQASACVDNFTDTCDQLAMRYRDKDMLAERAILPVRYNSEGEGSGPRHEEATRYRIPIARNRCSV